MKNIESDEIEKLLGIISPAPLVRIGHFVDDIGEEIDVLRRFCDRNDYEYFLSSLKNEIYAPLEKYHGHLVSKIQQLDIHKQSYMRHGIFYDYLFVSAGIESEERAAFVQKCHKVIKNAGLFMLFLRKGNTRPQEWMNLLEEHYFVATSTIEIGRGYVVVIGKKMHGWGG